MSSVSSTGAAPDSRDRRRTMNQITDSFREMAVVMTVLNLRAGEQVGLRDVEMKALDVLMRDGAMLINTGRSWTIDGDALLGMLRRRDLARYIQMRLKQPIVQRR